MRSFVRIGRIFLRRLSMAVTIRSIPLFVSVRHGRQDLAYELTRYSQFHAVHLGLSNAADAESRVLIKIIQLFGMRTNSSA
jgi:hypothetical protein